MSLKSLSYSEFLGEPLEWTLSECDFTQINLVVGKNATGKTRLVQVINSLCALLSGKITQPFQSGNYLAELDLGGRIYKIELQFSNGFVVRENLIVDGVSKLTRESSGKGNIYYEGKKDFIDFQVDPKVIAIQQRRDELQHPFVVDIAKWAAASQLYSFGTSLGRDRLMMLTSYQAALEKLDTSTDSDDLVPIYARSFSLHGSEFDASIISDMKEIGYDLTDVGTDDMRPLNPGLNVPEPVIGIFVVEKDRSAKLTQFQMSQGMFRALAMIIHINAASFDCKRTLVLLDDVGEGLDFERSIGLIDILTKHAKKANLQIIMTTNDRFVMNRVPLEHWSLLRRTGSLVKAFTERNSPAEFSDFKFMGLNNFDFFASSSLH